MVEFLRYFRYLAACKATLIMQLQVFLAVAAGPVLYAGLQKSIIDKLFVTLDDQLLLKFVLILAFASLYTVAFLVLKSLVTSRLKAALTLAIRKSLLERMFRFGLPFYARNGAGGLTKNVFEDVSIVSDTIARISSACGSVILLGGIGAYFYLLEPWVFMFFAGMSIASLLWALIWRQPIVRSNHNIGVGYTRSYQLLWTALPAIKGVKLGNGEKDVTRAMSEHQEFINRALIVNALGNSFFWQISFPIAWLCYAFVLAKGMQKVEAGLISTGTLLALISLVWLIMDPIRGILELFGIVQAGISAADRLKPIRKEVAESDPPEAAGWTTEPGIEFQSVRFSYDGKKNVLDEVSFRIPHTGWTTIVGASGSGKSTILRLAVKLTRGYAGKITFGGRELSELNAASLRGSVALVTQENQLLPLTFRENLDVYGTCSDWEIEDLLKALSLDGKLARIKGGLSADVSASGYEFSGGERQRICLARALLSRKEAILLDEVTSALDPGNEEIVMQVLKARFRGKLIVSVSHHPSMVLSSDWIILLKDGVVKVAGTPASVRESGHFKDLFPGTAGAVARVN